MIKSFRTVLLVLASAILITPVAVFFLLSLAIDDQPSVERVATVAPKHVERAMQLVRQHRVQSRRGSSTKASILAEDIDIAANYLVKLFTNGTARVRLSHRRAEISASVPLPLQSFSGYVNFQVSLTEAQGLPQLHSLRVGQLAIPDSISQFLTLRVIAWLKNHPQFGNGIDAIEQVRFSAEALNIAYRLQGRLNASDQYSLPVLSRSEREKIYRYHLFLVENGVRSHSTQSGRENETLARILQPLMQLAARHSGNNQAAQENRAAILAATFYILKRPLSYVIPEATHWPRAKHQTITLDGRHDFAQHFIVSAAITAYADTFLSDAIGLYKEIEDARSGSGFSFNDIAADRAGTLFGERATANQSAALRIQRWAEQEITDDDLMPAWRDLPEHLPQPVFKKHYGNMDTPAYQHLMDTIEQRVSALSFLH